MLKDNKSYPASDIWALGCTIFKMITGEVPFNGQSDYHTFQKIIEGKIEFNDYQMSDEAKDLITKLLQIDPSKRLGAGPRGSPSDYNALKSHDFFKGLDFSKLNDIEIPLIAELVDESPKDKLMMNQSFSQR